jgi:hypothetical protein
MEFSKKAPIESYHVLTHYSPGECFGPGMCNDFIPTELKK